MANLKYDETFPVKVAEYAAKGDTDARIAARLGIALSTFYIYKEQFPEFAEGLVAGRRICYSRVRAMLLKVARGQCTLTTKVFKNGELYKTTERNLPPNLKAIIYFQKHMRVGEVKIKEAPAQTDSEISNFGRLSGELCWPHGHKTENAPAQADSEISNFGRLSGELCWPHGHKTESAPAQADSKISNLGISQTCPTSPTEPQRALAQADFGISNLKVDAESTLPQADSKISNLGASQACSGTSA